MTANDYSFGNGPETEREQRREFRLTGRVTVELELESPDPEESGQPHVLTCYTSDLSATGIRVVAREPATEGAIIPAYIELERAGEKAAYTLMVEVVWCRAQDDGLWQVGLRVLESDDTAVLEWLETMAQALEDD
ncbi:PilZ domain-containing protein [Marinobacter fonticola]|uniref:PilZ domain-containing protein n=1 Tax=Marinobacter fonticola TaxID=2603215 RepID=UPI0011E89529|nr:PilZ domain-containing protein [Marinobacter fonticola]